jgi:hypothetical protein
VSRSTGPRRRSQKWLERTLYAIAIAIPAIYFAHGILPVDTWLGRISLRNPVVVDRPQATQQAPSAGTPVATDSSAAQRLYRCENGGATVWSDRPCGNVVETRDISAEDMNVLPSRAFTGADRAGDAASDLDCDALRERLDGLDARRRKAGTGARADAVARERDALWATGHAKHCW